MVKRVTGALKYLDDLPSGDCLHGQIVTLPVPAARIESIHKEKALRLEGVVAVYDLSDFKGRTTRFGPLVQDRPILADGAAKYEGDLWWWSWPKRKSRPCEGLPVEIAYKEMPSVTTIAQALAPEAPLVHDSTATNADNSLLNTNVMGEWEFGWGVKDAARKLRRHHRQHLSNAVHPPFCP